MQHVKTNKEISMEGKLNLFVMVALVQKRKKSQHGKRNCQQALNGMKAVATFAS